jgi:hypothetical protein
MGSEDDKAIAEVVFNEDLRFIAPFLPDSLSECSPAVFRVFMF